MLTSIDSPQRIGTTVNGLRGEAESPAGTAIVFTARHACEPRSDTEPRLAPSRPSNVTVAANSGRCFSSRKARGRAWGVPGSFVAAEMTTVLLSVAVTRISYGPHR